MIDFKVMVPYARTHGRTKVVVKSLSRLKINANVIKFHIRETWASLVLCEVVRNEKILFIANPQAMF